ncbi:MAG: hypothetical protein QNJ98_09860 [Planctomycetota bacterium]|nr:hypothetical protein [Planctomycetota bacterium]
MRRSGGRTAVRDAASQWTLWWELNRWRYLPTRAEVLARQSSRITGRASPSELLDAWEQRRSMLASSVAVPYLWRVLTLPTAASDEVQAAALIAFARVAQEPEAVDLVLGYATNPKKTGYVRESAAIALGHFHRTDPAQQLTPLRLDLLRKQLFQIVDDVRAPVRTRAFAAMSIGMLGDQPFGSRFAKDGRVVTRELWSRLQQNHAGHDLPVALLTALGMQPPAGVPDAIRKDLQSVALGKRLFRRKWSSVERSHALTARLRLGGRDWPAMLNRVLGSRQLPLEVRRAGLIGLSARAHDLDVDERVPAFEAWKVGMRRAKDPLTRGLATIALGHLLAADLRAGRDAHLIAATDAGARLLRRAESGGSTVRGFAAVALGVAARESSMDLAAARAFRTSALTVLRRQLAKGRGDDDLAAAYAAALGLMEDEASVPLLADILRDRGRAPSVRGRSAVALAQIGNRTPRVMVGLQAAVMDHRNPELRREAGLALSFLATGSESRMLVGGLTRSASQQTLAQTALALGQIGQLEAVKGMLEAARDASHGASSRALAMAALGLILNPDERPSLTRIRFDANYPARTNALHEVFDIL